MSASESRRLDNKEGSSNKAPLSNQHQIYQTDEAITVICNEAATTSSPNNYLEHTRSSVNENESTDDNEHHTYANESDVKLKISEENLSIDSPMTTPTSDSIRKKSVSFKNDENIKKFISGEEIVDKRNPFRSLVAEEITSRKILKLKRNGAPTSKRTNDETDFISKEEILKQSKYVPVYIRNPDRVLTYDKSVLENFSNRTKNVVKKAPIPIPRKTIKKPKEKKNEKPHGKYPDLSEIKVWTFRLKVIKRLKGFFSNFR